MLFRRKIEDHVAEKVATKVFENFKEKKPKKLKTPAKRSMIRDILENTDDYELVARKEGEEFVVRIRKPYMTISTISQDYVIKDRTFTDNV